MIAGRGAGVFVEETDGKGRVRAPLPERANAAVLQPTGKHNIAEDVLEPRRIWQQKEKPS